MLRTVLDDTRVSEIINVDDKSERGVLLGCQRMRMYRRLDGNKGRYEITLNVLLNDPS